ncbi:MAG: DNA mismatch repair endonuclease MutL [Deltaproteobacteria bacterium]|nr:DNA mismatch repair endonuclease MutL [Deltaproteobacteria bacterium]
MKKTSDFTETDSVIIRQLDNEVINCIAAGEVIERPASVVKELVENALDAQAETIEVHLENGGLSRIIVSDDGYGMSAENAVKAPIRHATSKLRVVEDLNKITTLGFRGEALSSIAAVSHFTLCSRRREDAVGTCININGGAPACIKEVGVPIGTTVDIADLFFNTPARKKFMRSAATEQAHVCEAALRAVLGSRTASLIVNVGDRRLIDLPATNEISTRARIALGPKVDTLYEFSNVFGGINISGVMAHPDVHRADTKGLWFFINGRYVRDRMLQRAVLESYRGNLQYGHYPFLIMYIDIPPAIVDVNVHPQKLEVRFSDAALIYKAVLRTIAITLKEKPWLQNTTNDSNQNNDAYQIYKSYMQAPYLQARETNEIKPKSFFYTSSQNTNVHPVKNNTLEPAGIVANNESLTAPISSNTDGYFTQLEVLGLALGTYLICAGNDEIVLIDQHAAYEYIAYRRLQANFERKSIEQQPLLFPEPVEISQQQSIILEKNWSQLQTFGFEIEPVGPSHFAVKTVPTAIATADVQCLAIDLIREVCSIIENKISLQTQDAAIRIFSCCANHVALAADARKLNSDEVKSLLTSLDSIDLSNNLYPPRRTIYQVFSRNNIENLMQKGNY